MINTAIAGPIASARLPVRANQNPSTMADSATTMGTNTPATRSARRCTGALPLCACSTSRAICDSVVSAPTRVARTTRRPSTSIVAPVTVSPTTTSRGRLSPVTREVSMAATPSTTTPSVAIRSPGRTTNRSPTRSSPAATVRSLPSGSSTRASDAPCSSSARNAPPARRFDRASNHRPIRISATVTEATSRYRWCESPTLASNDISIDMPLSPASVKNRAYALHRKAAPTPTDTSVSIEASPWRRFFHATRWNGQAAQVATGADIANASHCQLRNCHALTIESTSTGTPRTPDTISRCRRGSMRSSTSAGSGVVLGTRAP